MTSERGTSGLASDEAEWSDGGEIEVGGASVRSIPLSRAAP